MKVLSVLCFCLIMSCTSLEKFVQSSKPTLSKGETRLTGIDFNSVNLEMDININNPNALSVTMAGLDYDLKIQNNSIVKGNKTDQLKIASRGKSKVTIPIQLSFESIYKSVRALSTANKFDYAVDCGLSFDIPLLGKQRLPIKLNGSIPIPKIPSIKVAGLKKNKLDFTGAELELQLEMKNPNSFDMLFKSLDYGFKLNGTNLANGKLSKQTSVAQGAAKIVGIKINLNFMQMGAALFSVLNGGGDLNYNLDGNFLVGSSLPMLGDKKFDLNKSGKISLK